MSCYGVQRNTRSKVTLPYLPVKGTLKDGRHIQLVNYEDKYESETHAILKKICDDGTSYPQESMDSVEDFRAYYLSHECYCLVDSDTFEVLGAFYVKPNFPVRSSHLANAGFIVKESARGNGVGRFMCEKFLQIARDLGYLASFFNLVYTSNAASVSLWTKLGFRNIGTIPKAGNLKGIGFVDAMQFYYDLTTIPKTENI
ncbi:uncharacterized protein LOC135497190 [Lineus longissimus]|uniref:uncharacterized protein LOC135497190 n=1 Tax=Lineus longissimus TaxID=88925 RepID=UPI002B4C6DB9